MQRQIGLRRWSSLGLVILLVHLPGWKTYAAEWVRIAGGSGEDVPSSVAAVSDGGVAVAGSTTSFGSGLFDAFVAKFDAAGHKVWMATYGGPGTDLGLSIVRMSNGYLLAGTTDSYGVGQNAAWFLRLDDSGGILWQKAYGGLLIGSVARAQMTPDGGIVAVGTIWRSGNLLTDVWAIKLAASGDLQWAREFGGTTMSSGNVVDLAPDGGYVLAGTAASSGAGGGYRAWILKIDAFGTVQWQRLYGALGYDSPEWIRSANDGGFFVAGTCSSGYSRESIWIMKLGPMGDVQWQKIVSTKGMSCTLFDSILTPDGGFLLAASIGITRSAFIKLGPDCAPIWLREYHARLSVPHAVIRGQDGGYFLTVQSRGFGGADVGLMKLAASGKLSCRKLYQNGRINVINNQAWSTDADGSTMTPSLTQAVSLALKVEAQAQVLDFCD